MVLVRGEGANNALQDGLNLAKTINSAIALSEGLKEGEKYDAAKTLDKYNFEMLERGKVAVIKSRVASTGGFDNIHFMEH